MKHLLFLFLLLSCMPICVSAQTLTESQRQEALECATKFCNLLVRFSNGERLLDTQIYALCAGVDCSAYDNIKTNSETTLRNYLLGIQQTYTKKLAMNITAPSLADSRVYVTPLIDVRIDWVFMNSEVDFPEASFTTAGVENIHIVFDVVQEYPSLGKVMARKLIYDTKLKKITGFVLHDGAKMLYMGGLEAMMNKDIDTAISYLEEGAQVSRMPTVKKECNDLAMRISLGLLHDIERAIIYAERGKDLLYIAYAKCLLYIEKNQYDKLHPYIIQLESLINKRNGLNVGDKSVVMNLLGIYYINPLFLHQNINKGMTYLKNSADLGNVISSYLIYIFHEGFGEDAIESEIGLRYLRKAIESGYPPAFYQWGCIMEFDLKDMEKALLWYLKAAESGSYIGMANAGKLLIEKGNKNEGLMWLKKSLEGRALEAALEGDIIDAPWPKSRADVEMLLNKYNTSNTSSSIGTGAAHTPMTSSTYSNNTSNSNYTTNSYTPSNNYSYRYRREFNEAKDEYCVALSMGYVQKQWVYDFGDTKEKVDVFGEDKYTNGVQFGVRIDPQFRYGFGINTGLYYEYYFDKSQDRNEEGIDYYCRAEEHSLYMPIHLKYSLNFSKWFQLAFYGGVGLDYGISGEIYARSNGETLNSRTQYDAELDMERFNASLEYGAAIRVNRFQMNVSMSKGLINMSGSDEYKVKQDKLINVGMSIYF